MNADCLSRAPHLSEPTVEQERKSIEFIRCMDEELNQPTLAVIEETVANCAVIKQTDKEGTMGGSSGQKGNRLGKNKKGNQLRRRES